MSLPTITPYPIPTDLPARKVAWRVDPRRAVLLVHDMQNYFVDAFTPGEPPIAPAIANIDTLRARCHSMGIPVVYTAQPGGQSAEKRALLADFWGPGLDDGPRSAAIVEPLAPRETDLVLTKWRYSAFQRTDLAAILREWDRDQLLVTGVYAHLGCLLTACEAFMRDVRPFFVADAMADFSADQHRMALTYAAGRCAVVASTDQIVEELRGAELSLHQMRAQVRELLDEPELSIGEHDNLIELGLDSVRIMNLLERWRRVGAQVSFVELAERPTLADWHTLVSSAERV